MLQTHGKDEQKNVQVELFTLKIILYVHYPPGSNSFAPENQFLEDSFPFEGNRPIFSCELLSFRECGGA